MDDDRQRTTRLIGRIECDRWKQDRQITDDEEGSWSTEDDKQMGNNLHNHHKSLKI